MIRITLQIYILVFIDNSLFYFMKAINRLLQYLEYKKIKPTAFEKAIGLSNGYLGVQKKRNADIGEGVILKLVGNCLDLSLSWLILGVGSMLKDEVSREASTRDPRDVEMLELLKFKIKALEDEIVKLKK